MSPQKGNKMSKYKSYPEPVDKEIGHKVAWYYYDNLKDAEACKKAARVNAHIDAARGYDFGYRAPGYEEITKDDRGLYVVVTP